MCNCRAQPERNRTKRNGGGREKWKFYPHLRERTGKSVVQVAQGSLRKRRVIIK